jgi:DNA-binding CsgD family transcriptional regulator
MTNMNKLSLSGASVEDLVRGYARDDAAPGFRCLACGALFEEGRAYPEGEALLFPERAARAHVAGLHGGAFALLRGLGDEAAGLPEVQGRVLGLLHEGRSDEEIAAKLGGKSSSTVRNHRFNLRKREAEARVFLALMRLLDERGEGAGRFLDYPAAMPARDERAAVTEAEATAIEAKHLRALPGGGFAFASWPKRQKEKLVLLRRAAGLFETGRRYSEPEVNALLSPLWDDYVTIRRYLIEYHFLSRKPDGSEYWLA